MIFLLRKLVINDKNFIYAMSIFTIMLSLSLFTLDNDYKQETLLTLIWICATFALQISTNNLFTSDYYDGVLEQIFIHKFSSKFKIITYKIFGHWLFFGSVMSIISSIFSFIIFDKDIKYSITIGFSLLITTLVVINISAVGNALTVSQNNIILGISQILVLPIIIPVFIYFKLLTEVENLSLKNNTLLIIFLIFTIIIVNSIIATYIALKFAIEKD